MAICVKYIIIYYYIEYILYNFLIYSLLPEEMYYIVRDPGIYLYVFMSI